MNKKDFTKELVRVAFSAMVCDSDIDETEKNKLKAITKTDFYFKEFDFEAEIDRLLDSYHIKGQNTVNMVLNNILSLSLDESQQMIILEVAIGMIRADKKIEQDEIDFVNQLIINLKIPSQIIKDRFGEWWILSNIISLA